MSERDGVEMDNKMLDKVGEYIFSLGDEFTDAEAIQASLRENDLLGTIGALCGVTIGVDSKTRQGQSQANVIGMTHAAAFVLGYVKGKKAAEG